MLSIRLGGISNKYAGFLSFGRLGINLFAMFSPIALRYWRLTSYGGSFSVK